MGPFRSASEGTKAEGYAKLDRTRLLLSARNLLGVRARAGCHKDFALEVEVRLSLLSDHQTMGPPVLSRKIYIRTSSHSEIRAETCLSGDCPKPCGRSSCPLRSATVPVIIHFLSYFIHLFSYNAIQCCLLFNLRTKHHLQKAWPLHNLGIAFLRFVQKPGVPWAAWRGRPALALAEADFSCVL